MNSFRKIIVYLAYILSFGSLWIAKLVIQKAIYDANANAGKYPTGL